MHACISCPVMAYQANCAILALVLVVVLSQADKWSDLLFNRLASCGLTSACILRPYRIDNQYPEAVKLHLKCIRLV